MRLAAVVVSAFWAVAAVVAIGARRPGASAAVGVGVDGHVVHRFSLSGSDRVRRIGHRFTTVTRLRDKITSSRAPLSRVTVTASR